MRILALYDIHGNADALSAVLADPRAQDPDVIVVGGDAVPGPFAGEVLRQLDNVRTEVRWVRGNGEREVAAASVSGGLSDVDVPARSAAFTAAEIGGRRARALGELPATVLLDGILFCHASPRRDDEILTRLTPDADVARALAGVDAPLVVAGHTHQQDDRMLGRTRFVNAGSVGWPYEGDARARWLWVEDREPHAHLTAYDAAAAGEQARAAGWPDMESIEASLITPAEPLEITQLFEQMRLAGLTS